MVSCFLTEPIENSILKFKAFINRFIPHHEIFIRIILMELNKLDTVVIYLFHNRVGQSLCSKCFTNTRCTLKDDVLFLFQYCCQSVVFSFSHVHIF